VTQLLILQAGSVSYGRSVLRYLLPEYARILAMKKVITVPLLSPVSGIRAGYVVVDVDESARRDESEGELAPISGADERGEQRVARRRAMGGRIAERMRAAWRSIG
jgi:hypothetical protein